MNAEHLPDSGCPLFVLSMWRSGSSLLYALLNKHPQIALLYEGELPQLQLLLRGHFHDGSWRERWEFWNEGASRHGLSRESMPVAVSDTWEAARIVYREFAHRKQASIWGEKSPHWYDNTLRMAEKFPDARFIFLWRDTSAVMKSIMHAASTERFFRKPGFATRVLVGTERLRNACLQLQAQGRRVHELSYEDLTRNPALCMQAICKFLNVPFERELVSLESADRSALFPGAHHSLVNGDRVIGMKLRGPSLPHALDRKIARYIYRWKQKSAGTWPAYPQQSRRQAGVPNVFELIRDRTVYRGLLCCDAAVKLMYSAVPIGLARSLRSWLRQRTFAHRVAQLSQ